MGAINWIQWNERAVGQNHPALEDVVNRPLRDLLIASGVSPDAPTIVLLTNLSSVEWAQIINAPTTLAGYGITDAFTPARVTTQIVTGSLSNLATENGTVTLGKKGSILKVVADRACWVRFYATSADRAADSGRAIEDDPAEGTFILGELIFTGALLTIRTGPVIGYYNGDGPVTDTIYYAIQNRSGGASTVQVDVTHIEEEV